MNEMFPLLDTLRIFQNEHKLFVKIIHIIIIIFVFFLGYFTNIFFANGIMYINHYFLKDDYKVDAMDIHSQYFSHTEKNFTVVVNNGWSSDLPTKIDVYSDPPNNGVKYNIICDGSPCNDLINIDKQSFKKITVVMKIDNIEQSDFSICVKASEYGNEENNNEHCYPSGIISMPSKK